MLELKCRCGWTKSFDESQIGIRIHCPQCDRDFPITDDPIAFSTRNTGSAELSFADEVEVPDETTPTRPRSPRPRPGSSHSPGASVSYRPTTGSRKLQHMKRERRLERQKSAMVPILIVVLAVVTVSAITYQVLSGRDRKHLLDTARAVGDRAIQELGGPTRTGILAYFDSNATTGDLMSDLDGVREQLGHTNFEFRRLEAPETGAIDEVTIVYYARQKSRGVECKLDFQRTSGQWKIQSYALRAMNPTEL